MKTLEMLYDEICNNEELKNKLLAALKEQKLEQFLKEQNCDSTENEFFAYVKEKREGELSDEELDSVAGGCVDKPYGSRYNSLWDRFEGCN